MDCLIIYCKAALRAGWTRKNHPHFVPVFFLAKPCAKRQSNHWRPIKSGKHIPMGFLIHKKLEDMKLHLIENICKQVITLVLLVGICLLSNKGIIPVYTIGLLFLSGGIFSLFLKTMSFIIKVLIVLLIIGILV